MAPNTVDHPTGVLDECDPDVPQEVGKTVVDTEDSHYDAPIVWKNVVIMSLYHVAAVYGVYMLLTGQCMLPTFLWAFSLYVMAGLGITAGAHRLWSHRAYKAKLPLRILLGIFQTMALQNHIYEWCRDHRVHHKYSETHADPHNANRGFFFAHMGWLLVRKHPSVISKGKQLQINDLEQDSVVVFQRKYYLQLIFVFWLAIPLAVPMFLWNESLMASLFVGVFLRYIWGLHMTWLVNSAAHFWGNRPYDGTINPSENLMTAVGALGEGWHNYHHTFPWDYKAAELGNYRLNVTTAFLDACAKLGLAYDMKIVSRDVVMSRVKRTGDGSHPTWGWGDSDVTNYEKSSTQIMHPSKQG